MPNVLSPSKRRISEAKGLDAGLHVLAYVIARAYTRDTQLVHSRDGAEVIYPQAEKDDPKENRLAGAGEKVFKREYARKKAEKSVASLTEPGMKAYLEPEEVTQLSQAATNLRDRLLIQLLFRLGCRISEVLAITVENIDLSRGLVSIQHLKTRLKLSCPNCSTLLGRRHSYCPNCGTRVGKAVVEAREHRRLRTLPIDKTTLQMLRDYIQRGGPIIRNGQRLIFGINRHRAWQIVRDCAEKAGLPELVNPETGRVHNVSPHRLRDAFAVHCMKLDDSGDGLRLLQEHLGHASFNTTARYRKVSGAEHRDWYDKLWKEANR